MTNPILQKVGNPQVKQMLNTIKASRNPQAAFNYMLQGNPQIRQIMDYVNQNGGDPKKAFYTMAQQKGVNPDDILSMLR